MLRNIFLSIIYLHVVLLIFITDEIEHWDEDTDLDADFPQCSPNAADASRDADDRVLDAEQRAVVWWVIVFTCVFQTLHSIPSRAVQWLLQFLYCLFTVLGRYSQKIAGIAQGFPRSIFLRAQYIKDHALVPTARNMVVCPVCHTLYHFEDCIEKRGSHIYICFCCECRSSGKSTPLLKQVITSKGSQKLYPQRVYPISSLLSSLQVIFMRPGLLDLCEDWRINFKQDSLNLYDVHDGQVWKDFFHFQKEPFLADRNAIALVMNVDWFRPYKHRMYSIGVVYLAIMNLPRAIRYKRENILIIGLLPGPSEPPKTINTYLSPLVSDLLTLWRGHTFKTCSNNTVLVRCALLCVACDLPAGRKVCGFLSYNANLGCTRCYHNFGTGKFGKQNYSGFNRDTWIYRSMDKHRMDVDQTLKCSSRTARDQKESEVGCRYSCLLQLPYFNAIRMLIIDPMHNLYLGTAKYIFSLWRNNGIIDRDAIKVINDRISKLNVPSNVRFSRLPSPIESATLTAEQWMIWVNYYSLFCLHELLSPEQFECWRHFVLASRLLSRHSVSKDDITLADAMLLQFCRRFQTIYGPDAVMPNMHFHCHLADCIRDFGPMVSFWLFSFERFNGLLGDQPTNNRSIEVQLMRRFTEDNARLQLLQFEPSEPSDVNSLFQQTIVDHAHSFDSVKHLDTIVSTATHFSSGFKYVPARKYTLAAFSESQVQILTRMYGMLYPSLPSVCLPQSYRKMLSISINEQEFCARQYVSAKGMFPFTSTCKTTHTVFSDPSLRPAKVHHFAIHTFYIDDSRITHGFAVVSWPLQHPLLNVFGKPYQVWCSSLYDAASDNCIIPLENISSLLLTAQYIMEEETVLVTVPVL